MYQCGTYAHAYSTSLPYCKQVMELYPSSIQEIDKKGQHFLSYVIRTNSVPLLEYFIASNKNCVRYKDGTGKQAVHYVG
jgi:hypothetical protein